MICSEVAKTLGRHKLSYNKCFFYHVGEVPLELLSDQVVVCFQ